MDDRVAFVRSVLEILKVDRRLNDHRYNHSPRGQLRNALYEVRRRRRIKQQHIARLEGASS